MFLFNAIYTIISYKILCCNERLLIVKNMPREIFLSINSDNAFANTLSGSVNLNPINIIFLCPFWRRCQGLPKPSMEV